MNVTRLVLICKFDLIHSINNLEFQACVSQIRHRFRVSKQPSENTKILLWLWLYYLIHWLPSRSSLSLHQSRFILFIKPNWSAPKRLVWNKPVKICEKACSYIFEIAKIIAKGYIFSETKISKLLEIFRREAKIFKY